MAFALQEKGELYAKIETTYGTTPAATTLVAADAQNMRSWKTRVVPVKVPVEDEGGGMIPGVLGQELLKVGEYVEYSGAMLLREYTVPGVVPTTAATLPPYDIWLRAGGFLAAAHSTSPNALTYNMSLAGNGESVTYRYREWGSDGTRKLHDVQGGRHSTTLKFVAGQGISLEISDGKGLTYSSPTNVVAADAPPSITLNDGSSVIPYLGATQALLQISGSTYSGKIREVNIGLPMRTEMLPDGGAATGFCEAFSNVMAPTFDMLVYEKNDALEIRDAWNAADAHFDLNLSVGGPGAAGNTLSTRVFFDIADVSEEAGPAGTKALRVTGKVLFADRVTAFDTPAIDPSVPPIQLVLTTT